MSQLTLSARLDRTDNQTSWGFRMHGGKEFQSQLSIQRVTPGSLAQKCGLEVGDAIIRIGTVPTDTLKHKDAQDMIIGSGNSLELTLLRSGGGGGSQAPAYAPSQPAPAPAYTPSQPAYQPQAPPSQQQTYNRNPQPFAPGGGGSSMPVAMNKQYNTPINMYSVGNVMDTLATQTANMNVSPPDVTPPWKSGPGGAGSPVYKNPGQPSAPGPSPGSGGTAGPWKPKIPTGPRKMRVGKVGEARNMGAQAGRVPVCNNCGTSIRGPFVAALDKTWCPDHFVCANPQCRVPLIDMGFVEEEGQLFCERDYEQYFAPRCHKCSAAIIGEVVNALRQTYHTNCFLCSQCHQPIGGNQFHTEEGKVYCKKDWAAMFQTKCYGCDFPIEPGDRWVEALNANWHSECFNCSTCQMNLEGQSFFAKNGKPYCKKHAMGGRF